MKSEMPPGYSIPPELLSATPRRVRRRNGFSWGLIGLRLFILPHTLVGVAILCKVVGEPVMIALTPNVPGVVTHLYKKSGSKGGTSYHVAYYYSPDPLNKFMPFAGDDSVPQDEFRTRSRADRIFVHAIHAGRFRYATISRSFGGYVRYACFAWFFAAFWNGCMSIFLYQAWVAPIIRKRLIRNGRPVAGKILSKYVSSGKSSVCRIIYEFTSAEIQFEHFVTEMNVTRADYDQATAGAAITILYDAARPKRSVAYEYSGFRAVIETSW